MRTTKVLLVVLAVLLAAAVLPGLVGGGGSDRAYSTFIQAVDAGRVERVKMTSRTTR